MVQQVAFAGGKGRGHLGFEAGASRQVDQGPICFSSCSGCITSCMCACERECLHGKGRLEQQLGAIQLQAVTAQPRQYGIKRTQSRTVRFRLQQEPVGISIHCGFGFVLTNPGRNLICADRIPARGDSFSRRPAPSVAIVRRVISQRSTNKVSDFHFPLPFPAARTVGSPLSLATSRHPASMSTVV